jgi:hypothetical protein
VIAAHGICKQVELQRKTWACLLNAELGHSFLRWEDN